jgi:glycosyltransferase involved in cell wall biosynthesis
VLLARSVQRAVKVLHVTPTYVPAWRYGGPIVSVHGLCKALVRRGHDVHVYTTTVDGDGDLDVPFGIAQDVDGVRVTYFRCDGPRRLYWSSALRSALDHGCGGFDVIHAHACFLLPPTWAARAAKRAGRPYVFSPRGMLVHDLIARRSAAIKRAWIRLFDAPTLRDAAAVHVTSDVERDDLLAVVPGTTRFAVVANGVDLVAADKRASRAPGDLRVLYLGRVSWKKGIDLAIRAVAAVPGANLRVVGNDEEGLRPQLEALVQQLRAVDRVQWSGPLYGADKDAAYADADVLLLPSLSENFGNTVLEAMAAGLPVVCTPGVGAGALVRAADCGLAIERKVDALADALRRLAADAGLRERMGAAGRAAAAEHSWDAKAAEMEQVYASCVAAAARAA